MHKYNFYVNGNDVICTTKFNGQTYKGIAHCMEQDKFNEVIGREIAQAKCIAKVTKAKMKKAEKALKEIDDCFGWVKETRKRAVYTKNNACDGYLKATERLKEVLNKYK